jgi:arylsulfatase A-like enzyme
VAETEPGPPSKLGGGQSTSVIAIVLALAIVGGGVLLSSSQEITIIVVSLDTTRPDHLSAYGYERLTSPSLAKLAREGVIFTNARSSTSWTLPAHMSLFTGLPTGLHDVNIDFQTLDVGRPILGEIFSEAGFNTEGFYTAPYVHQRYGFGRGMEFFEPMTANPMLFDLPAREMRDQMGLREMFSHQEVTTPRVTQQALRFLRDAKRPKNLLFLHLFDPHYDYKAGPKFRAPFVDPSYAGEITGEALMSQLELISAGDPADLRQLEDLYDAELSFTDAHLQHVINAVKLTGRLGKTIIVVVADHGEEFFEHGRYGHRMGLHDEVLRVPLIIWGPGIIPEGLTIEEDVTIYDVLPTLMDYADIDADPLIYGRSLRPLIEGGSLPPRASWSSLTFLHADGRDYYTLHESIVYEGLKLIRRVRVPWSPLDQRNIYNDPDWDTVELEVYDLREDPGEQTNLVLSAPDDPRIELVMQAFQDEAQRQQTALGQFNPEGTRDIDANIGVLDMIKELGYAGMMEQGSQSVTGPRAESVSSEPEQGDPQTTTDASDPSQDPGR